MLGYVNTWVIENAHELEKLEKTSAFQLRQCDWVDWAGFHKEEKYEVMTRLDFIKENETRKLHWIKFTSSMQCGRKCASVCFKVTQVPLITHYLRSGTIGAPAFLVDIISEDPICLLGLLDGFRYSGELTYSFLPAYPPIRNDTLHDLPEIVSPAYRFTPRLEKKHRRK
ncbi:uncharacterized protein LOC142340463 [Convolutriloba macropyga]|uniref:uncharacterized protein LOC142340463 n=1 Tax=Convolutriloba macropyga TaxID=536237 RepID=UPI003F525E2C